MKVIIMGCGRVGEQLARLMSQEGHDVTVIDPDAVALARLGDDFCGKKVKGIGFDRDVLIKAGIERVDAFAAASASDNANVVAARIARLIFRVPRVVARLYDPRRAEIYRRLGLLTISSTTWGAERIRELITHSELDPLMTFGNGDVSLLSIETPPLLVGRQVRQLQIPGEIQVIAITRQGQAFVPLTGTEFQPRDVIHLTIMASSMGRLKELLGWETGGVA
jgi:trk system potassium uptake protein TrkA